MPVGRSAARGPLPLWHWCLSSGPLGQRFAVGPVRMVLHCGQCHSDRQPFMASPCTESSLPPPHRGSHRVANANHGRQHKGTAKITNTKGATCLSLGGGGGGGADLCVNEMCLAISHHECTYLGWQKRLGASSRRPRHPGPHVPAGRRAKKCLKNEAKGPFQSVSNLSMNGSEPYPGTAGNLSLHERSDVPQPRRNCTCGTSGQFCIVWTIRHMLCTTTGATTTYPRTALWSHLHM